MPCIGCGIGNSFKGDNIQGGGELIFLEYRVFFKLHQGTIICLRSSEAYRGTWRNIIYTQIGVALIAKTKVATTSSKRQFKVLKFK